MHRDGAWMPVHAELFTEAQKREILEGFDAVLKATGFVPEETWDPDFARRKVIQTDLVTRLPNVSVNLGGATSADITQPGVDKAWGLKRPAERSGIAEEKTLFIGDAIFPGGNDYPAKAMGLDTVCVRDSADTFDVVTAIIACQKAG